MGIQVVWPSGAMSLLTQIEADRISLKSQGELYDLYRNCSLAVLNSGNLTDNSKELLENYQNFEIDVVRNERGLKLELINPPKSAIVDGQVIKTIQKHLYSVLRDIVQIRSITDSLQELNVTVPVEERGPLITNGIFHILRAAEAVKADTVPNIAVCWGGHSIPQDEYDYAYRVGKSLGLRGIDICTGCGPGIMEAPMRGSLEGHALQDNAARCERIGLTEPSIIAAEPPNPFVSNLVIMPDIEKRLEAFVRLGHVLIVFPGGPGTAEELLYILGIKLCHENRHNPIPIILTGNTKSKPYFDAINEFLIHCFGDDIKRYYQIIIDDEQEVAQTVAQGLETVHSHRTLIHESYCYNWSVSIPDELQQPFNVTHESMAALNLSKNQEPYLLAANLRRAFSGIVTGNVKEYGIKQVAEKGPFKLHGDKSIIEYMGKLMTDFIAQGRILLSQKDYVPCYELAPLEDKAEDSAKQPKLYCVWQIPKWLSSQATRLIKLYRELGKTLCRALCSELQQLALRQRFKDERCCGAFSIFALLALALTTKAMVKSTQPAQKWLVCR